MNNLRDPGLVVVLGLAVLVCDLVARRIRIAPPVVLLVCGALLGFVPTLRSTHLPPSAVLLLFLPALLYWESLTTSLREIRFYLRLITLLSTVLIAATAAAVAVAGHAFGLPWGPAWVLGRRWPRPTPPRSGCWPARCPAGP
jgi:CPA1 family monovalent cation:H+ antiporter